VKSKLDGRVYRIEFAEMQWADATHAEGDVSVVEELFIDHRQLGHLTWWLIEQPIGLALRREHHLEGHRLLEDFEIILEPEGLGRD
jgi:hypothetical protein